MLSGCTVGTLSENIDPVQRKRSQVLDLYLCVGEMKNYKFVYYESITRGLKRGLIYEYRRDERLKTKNEESTLLVDTGLVVELEHLKIKTRLIDDLFFTKTIRDKKSRYNS